MNCTTAYEAVERSISHNERARLVASTGGDHRDDRVNVALDALEAFGLEGRSEENDGSIDCWGTERGNEWRVLIVAD